VSNGTWRARAAAGPPAPGRTAGWRIPGGGTAAALVGAALIPALLVVSTAGCGVGRPVVPTDPDRARAVLDGVLSAWRDGATPADLRKRNPPVHVADERWLGGEQIERFTLGAGESFGTAVRIPAELTLASVKRSVRAFYIVTTEPAVSVVLAD
jgi:hypothetical protein